MGKNAEREGSIGMKKKICDRCCEEYESQEMSILKYFDPLLICIPCEKLYEMKFQDFKIEFLFSGAPLFKRKDVC